MPPCLVPESDDNKGDGKDNAQEEARDKDVEDGWMLAGTRRRQHSCVALAPSAKAAKSRFLPPSADCRQLISEADGNRPVTKSVWYIGNLRQDIDETKLGDFVERRANELDAKMTLFKPTVFKKK